jgi:hypothetical protein
MMGRAVFLNRFAIETVLGLLIVGAAHAQGYQKIAVSPEFEKAFREAFECSRALEQYEAAGNLAIKVVSDGKTQDLQYEVAVIKRKPGSFAVSISRPSDGHVLARVVSMGRNGKVSLYLPRELVMAATPQRIGQVVDTYTLPVVITLFDFLDDGKVDRWMSMMGRAEYAGREKLGEPDTERLKYMLNNYWTLREIGVDMWVSEGEQRMPLRIDVDLTKALTQRGPSAWVKPGGSVNLSVTFSGWKTDAEPKADIFDQPTPPEQYGELNLRDVLTLAESGVLPMLASVDPSQLASQLQSARAGGGNQALIERLKKATPEQRQQLMTKARGYAANGGAERMVRAAQSSGLTSSDIERLKEMIGK